MFILNLHKKFNAVKIIHYETIQKQKFHTNKNTEKNGNKQYIKCKSGSTKFMIFFV